MISKETVEQKEELIRKLVRELPNDKRLRFFEESSNKLKDPDTYAALNCIFIAGLHHFYLGHWLRGLLNISLFWIGVAMLFTDYFGLGVLVVLSVSAYELYELFRSQIIVQDYNNNVMEGIYKAIHGA